MHAALGNIDWAIFAFVTIGAVPGARIGATLALGTRERTLRLLVGGFMLLVAVAYGARRGRRPPPGLRDDVYDGASVMTTRRAARALLALCHRRRCVPRRHARRTRKAPSVCRSRCSSQTPWSTSYKRPRPCRSRWSRRTPAPRRSATCPSGLTIGPNFASRVQYEIVAGGGSRAPRCSRPPSRSADTLAAGKVRTFTVAVDLSAIAGDQPDRLVRLPRRVDLRSAASRARVVHDPRPVPRAPAGAAGAVLVVDRARRPGGVRARRPAARTRPSRRRSRPGGSLAAPVEALPRWRRRSAGPIRSTWSSEPSLLEQVSGWRRATTVDGTQVAAGGRGRRRRRRSSRRSTRCGQRRRRPAVAAAVRGPVDPRRCSRAAWRRPPVAAGARAGDARRRSPSGVPLASPTSRARPPGRCRLRPSTGSPTRAPDGARRRRHGRAAAPAGRLRAAGHRDRRRAQRHGVVTLVLPDPGTQGLLERPDLLDRPRPRRPGRPRRARGDLEGAARAAVSPTARRPSAARAALPSSLPPASGPPLLERLGDAPFLAPAHAQDLVAGVEPRGARRPRCAPRRRAAFPFDYAAAIRDAARRHRRLRVDAHAGQPGPGRASPRPPLRGVRRRTSLDPVAGQPWLDAVAATTQAAFASTTPQVDQAFTFTSGEGTIPLRMGDPGPIPLRGHRPAAVVPVHVPGRRPPGRRPGAPEPGRDVPRRREGVRAEPDRGRRAWRLPAAAISDADDRRALDGGQQDRAAGSRSARRRSWRCCTRGGGCGGGRPELIQLSPDSREATVRSAAVMSAGTLLSRVTGLVRVSVDAGRARLHRAVGRLQRREHHPEHRLRAGPRRDPHVGVRARCSWTGAHGRAVATASFEAASRFLTIALVVLSAVAALGRRRGAVDHAPVPRRRRAIRCAGAGGRARHVLPAVVHAADRLLRHRRRGGGRAHREPPVRRADVRAGAEQPRRDRDDAASFISLRHGADRRSTTSRGRSGRCSPPAPRSASSR